MRISSLEHEKHNNKQKMFLRSIYGLNTNCELDIIIDPTFYITIILKIIASMDLEKMVIYGMSHDL